MSKTLVIVESPTKAKTLKKFLGKDYVVESSVGHIRDLPKNAAEIPAKFKKEAWSRLGVNVEEDFTPLYIVQPEKRQKIRELKAKLKEVDRLLLATDEDREGEAISWHLVEELKPKVPYQRMVFHEITKKAILEALGETREIDSDLVQAQESRRVLDRLYGYEVSPILWKKIKPKLSAGRVQSVATKILVDRERARMRFVRAEYWDLSARFTPTTGEGKGKEFEARLTTLGGKRIASGKDFDPDTGKLKRDDVELLTAASAKELKAKLETGEFTILSAEEKPFSKSPAAPFTTSTLQQEGNRKLRFDAKRTMRAAQRLYENGFITYMRTDSVTLSTQAIELTRAAITESYGGDFVPDEPRLYKGKSQNAQEAHEAIRPAGEAIAPVSEIRKALGEDEAKVYELIWMRTLACQMKDAKGRRMVLKVGEKDGTIQAVCQASGSVIDFPGFLRAYVEGSDDPDAALADKETILPPVAQGDDARASVLDAEEHHTTPPARLTEATLVKTLEEEGIGRPSTYASIIDTILRRDYTFKKGSALVPTFTAFAVVSLMEQHMGHLIDPSFTAKMESSLDAISRGDDERLPYLRKFYDEGFERAPGLRPLLDKKVEDIDARTVCSIPIGKSSKDEDLIVRVGRYGPFIQCGERTAPIPAETAPDEISAAFAEQLIEDKAKGDEPLGVHPESNLPIFVKTGRYGPYVQLGSGGDGKEKPKMVSLLKGMTVEDVDLEIAIALSSLPRSLGDDGNGEEILAYNGRYGPYIKRGADTRSLTADDHLLSITRERALELLAEEKRGRGRAAAPEPIKVFKDVKDLDGGEIKLLKGRYGPYVSDGEVNASLPRDFENPESITESFALELLEIQREKKGKKKAKKKASKKAAKKKTTKKKAAKKAPSRKKTAAKDDDAAAADD
ncbi:MAG: type I DNA topoisomerase [Planctomycetota bacterium]|nr:type I DNA topoisomerase [Planctomycetota bacterium]